MKLLCALKLKFLKVVIFAFLRKQNVGLVPCPQVMRNSVQTFLLGGFRRANIILSVLAFSGWRLERVKSFFELMRLFLPKRLIMLKFLWKVGHQRGHFNPIFQRAIETSIFRLGKHRRYQKVSTQWKLFEKNNFLSVKWVYTSKRHAWKIKALEILKNYRHKLVGWPIQKKHDFWSSGGQKSIKMFLRS